MRPILVRLWSKHYSKNSGWTQWSLIYYFPVIYALRFSLTYPALDEIKKLFLWYPYDLIRCCKANPITYSDLPFLKLWQVSITLTPIFTESIIELNCIRSSYYVNDPLYVPNPTELTFILLLLISYLKFIGLNFYINYLLYFAERQPSNDWIFEETILLNIYWRLYALNYFESYIVWEKLYFNFITRRISIFWFFK